jgi:hypothetical protein
MKMAQWCARHLNSNDGARHNARHDGIEDRMVSANLPGHTPVTEIASLTRTATYLTQGGSETTPTERNSYETRKKRLLSRLSQGDRE